MKCPRCQQDDPSHSKFCLECAAPLTGTAPRSHADLKDEIEGLRHALGEALEQQTATAEILRVISQSPRDVQPVFETIVRNATKLCDGTFSAVFRWDRALLDFAAAHNWTEQAVEALRAYYPIPATRETGSSRAILDRAVVQIADIEQDPEYRGTVALAVGFRSGLFVPMMREGTPVGAISVGRAATGPFSNGHVELLKTFAQWPNGREDMIHPHQWSSGLGRS